MNYVLEKNELRAIANQMIQEETSTGGEEKTDVDFAHLMYRNLDEILPIFNKEAALSWLADLGIAKRRAP